MVKASRIVDHLLDRIQQLDRRDLEQRVKRLRTAGLYPVARGTSDRKVEPVTEYHLANLLLALVGTIDAMNSATAFGCI